jgi:hypothetical protein
MPSCRILAVSALAALVSSGAAFAPAPSSLPLRSAQRSSACSQINMSGGHHEETVRLTRGECKCIHAYVLHLEGEPCEQERKRWNLRFLESCKQIQSMSS